MIIGMHALIYSEDAERTRAFFRDVLQFSWVDAGEGWLIFTLPPAELGIHPEEHGGGHVLSLMCDDVQATMRLLKSKGVEFTGTVADRGFGLVVYFKVPGAGEMMLYQPKHPMAIHAPAT